jgi:hypothetical protein
VLLEASIHGEARKGERPSGFGRILKESIPYTISRPLAGTGQA